MKSASLVLAIEFPGPTTLKPYFDRALAQGLANQLAFELAKHLPSVEGLGLAWMAGVYDQAQLLRPGFPVFKALSELYKAGLNGDALPQVLTLQALRGQAPLPALQVDERLLGGPMVLVPICISGPDAQIDAAQTLLETKLLDSGLTDARTALFLNQALGVDAEHARLMTLDDLSALTAIQLEHMGFADVWHAIEHQLYALPSAPADNDLLTLSDGKLKLKLHAFTDTRPSDHVASTSQAAQSAVDQDKSTSQAAQSAVDLHAHQAQRKLRERQAMSLLQAHDVAFDLQPEFDVGHSELADQQSYWLHWLEAGDVKTLTPISHPSIGLLCVRLSDQAKYTLGFAHPLAPDAWLLLRQRFGV